MYPQDILDGTQPSYKARGKLLLKDALRISVCRSLYLSSRYGGRIVILRGTRIRLARGARIRVPPGCRLVLGKSVAGAACSLDIGRNARLTVKGCGSVTIVRGTRILLMDGAHLEIGGGTTINFGSTITCFKHIDIAVNVGISWNANIIDGNVHELIVAGVPRARHRPVRIGTNVWIGTGAIIRGATIGDGAVVGTGSVVVSDVPSKVLVAGNPAQVIREDVSWVV